MCKTIVISTTEQANAMLEHLESCKVNARREDYASERKKPIKWLSCTCCGEQFQGRQWWNQDCGYGLGDCCLEYCGVDPNGGEVECYGMPGIHFLIPETEKANPPIVEDRGECLHAVDERLRIECSGYVYWRGIQIEHWSGSLLDRTEHSIGEATELVHRCELLESRNEPVSFYSIISIR